jgi:hypothetical protein
MTSLLNTTEYKLYMDYLAKFGKSYSNTADLHARKNIFIDKLAYINEINS